MIRRTALTLGLTLGFLLAIVAGFPGAADPPSGPVGRTATLLPDGRWLLLGGEGPRGVLDTAEVWDPSTLNTTRLTPGLQHARAWHTATVLPDGQVLILGGLGADGRGVQLTEIFVPDTGAFEPLIGAAPSAPRAGHSATVLTDGRVLIAGGTRFDGAEVWDPRTGAVTAVPETLLAPRSRHAATLLPSGEVLLSGGVDASGQPVSTLEVYDPAGEHFTSLPVPPSDPGGDPTLTGSAPDAGATDVPTDAVVGLRFSTPLRGDTVTPQTMFLSGPGGLEPASVVVAEGGRLAFVRPEGPLAPGTTYFVTLNGPTDALGRALPFTSITFTTALPIGTAAVSSASPTTPSTSPSGRPRAPRNDREAALDDEVWVPTAPGAGWKTNLPPSPWERLPLLEAPKGVTALAGRVLTIAGDPLPHVTLEIEGQRARTDHTGRFLLRDIPAGHQELLIDGRTASRSGRTFGVFEVGVVIYAGRTIGLPYTIWMPRIDTEHAVTLASPTTQETLITTPTMPGVEVRIPAGTTITDHEHQPVTEVSLTPMPLDRPPFPLPAVEPPAFFTIQPGAGYVYGRNGGARVIYPNLLGWEPKSSVNFWHYDTSPRGWYIYGNGQVTSDGTQAVPDPGVAIYEFTAAMVEQGQAPPELPCPAPGNSPEGGGGDPVDLGTGLFVMRKTDLSLGGILPVNLTRTYRPRDSVSRPFGRGSTHPYAMFVRSLTGCQDALLVLPDGGRIRFVKVSGSAGCATNIVLEHTETPTQFFKARLDYDPQLRWRVTLKDGTVYRFRTTSGALESIQDRFGNWIKLSGHYAGVDPTLLETSTGRWLRFTYDASARITQVQDNIGRTVSYTYDGSGRLTTATDAAGGVTEYTYDQFDRMLTLKDPRNIVYLTNAYDAAGRVITQTQADGTTFQIAYTLDGTGNVIQADVTDPRGFVRRVTFNAAGYVMSETRAVGQAIQQTTTWERQAGTNLVTAIVDPLSRRTEYAYDSQANLLTVTRLAGTGNAVTTTYTYEPTFNQVATITDPLSHTTSFTYDSKGALATITNPLNHQTTMTTNAAGQPTQINAPLGVTTQLTYDRGDLLTISDTLGNTARRFVDGAGRYLALTDPRGQTTRYEYDALNRLIKTTDARGSITTFGYDPNGNLLSVTDARNGVTGYTYNNMDRLITRTDPLLRQETYQYDNNGNPTQVTDRKSQITTLTYDALNRRTQASYAGGATTTYTYDAGHRLTSAVDSIAGTISQAYDGLNRLTQEVAPEGTVNYTYDAANRRATMTVAGQPTVSYTYDNADRLTQIMQSTSTVALAYDAVSRQTSLTLPNGIVVEYAYDTALRLTGLTYKLGAATLGTISYTYDAAGNRGQVGGIWARTNLPAAVSTASYNAANQQLTLGPNTMTYDNNGNLATRNDGSGLTTLSWDSRNRLTGLSGPGLTGTFGYDGLGRRRTKTINGARTDFLYDGLNPVQEGILPSTVGANILTGLGIDDYFTRTDASGTRIILGDALGSTLALTDSAGAVQTQYTYEPFGATTASGPSSANSFQFTGRENDGTGFHYYRARYYHPTLQRFIAEDPIRLRGGDVNFYSYVRNSPTRLVDPLGLATLLLGGGVNAIVPTGGGELGGGIAVDFGPNGCPGVYGYVGAGSGLNISTSFSGGVLFGGLGDLAGPFGNFTAGGGIVSITILFSKGQVAGFTINVGPGTPRIPVGVTGTVTGVIPICGRKDFTPEFVGP